MALWSRLRLPRVRIPGGRWRWWALGSLAVVAVLAYAIAFVIAEPLRRTTERQLNEVEKRGWQEALAAIYPLEINTLVIRRGQLVYAEEGPFAPLDLRRIKRGFDVKGGTFSFFSEISVNKSQVAGYVKPLFKDIDVYDPNQDRHKHVFRRAYEAVVGASAQAIRPGFERERRRSSG